MDEYRRMNYANWEARVPVHLGPGGYDLEHFVTDPELISNVVRFDHERLGDIANKRVVHLQCHLGTDTLSLARLGATVTGLDFSPSALAAARDLAQRAGADIDYVEADVYDAAEVLGAESFDLVYTGIGAIGWLPSIERWAQTVSDLLTVGGELFIRDCHPVLFTLDDERTDGVLALEYPYFDTTGTVFVADTTYAGDGTPLDATETMEFNHGLAEIFNALWAAGMDITVFEEHDTVPWAALGDLMEEVGDGEFRLKDRPNRVPMSFTIGARKVERPSRLRQQ